ncbi:MAG: branched-chain amino acid ABC transporter permease [Trueperaceae bacterium]|nr:branched-chain amino acid ABC transporter permease [Truepera sp.]
MTAFLQTLIFGLGTGAVISVGAVGLSLSYGVTRFINFSYGELLTLGAYLAFVAVSLGLSLPVASLLAMVVVGLIGVVLARLLFDPILHRGFLSLLVTSVGLAFVLQNAVRMIFGSSPTRFPLPPLRPWRIGALIVPKVPVLVIVIAALAMACVHLLLRYTRMGKMMRATSDDAALAKASGIVTGRVLATTWFLSAAIAALGGVLLGMTQIALQPVMGWGFLLVVFAAVLLGGIGNPYGAMLGALIVGLGIEFGAAYLAPDYGHAFAFLLLVLVLLLRPKGLLRGSF